MKNIKLNQNQITELIKYKKTLISDNISIELYDDELVYNDNGNISSVISINLKYEENTKKNNYIQQLICDHLHIEPHNVIINNLSPEDCEFRIRFTPQKELSMIVCPITTAIYNSNLNKEERKIATKASYIGIYRRLGNSFYFFRWDSDTHSAKW